MKRTESLYRTAVLLLLLMLAAACTRDDIFDDPAPGNGTDPAAPLAITVTDGAYASAPSTSAADTAPDGTPVTRAVEKGFATEFTAGDAIGIYVVNKAKEAVLENGKFTYNGHTWEAEPNGALPSIPHDDEFLYFAYYPYQRDMTGRYAVNIKEDNTEDFFWNLIYLWNVKDDQSTYAKYTASDLMVAQGVVSTRTDGIPGSLLNFTMQHQMLLNIVRLPYIKSTYTEEISGNQQTKSYDLYTGAQLPKFWKETPHQARLITNPYIVSGINCSYYDSNYKEHKFNINTSQGNAFRGKYKTYTVDGATETKSDRPLRDGDFYMKDGTVLPQEAFNNGADIPDDVKKDCLGVVFWVGEKDGMHWTQTGYKNGDHLLTHDHPTCTHGIVVALQNASDSPVAWATNPLEKALWDWAAYDFNGFTDNEISLWKMIRDSAPGYGYVQSALFGLYTAHNKGADFPAYEAVKTYAGIYSTPEGCSGWFFPSRYELITIWFDAPGNFPGKPSIVDRINRQIKKAGGTELEGSYWTSYDYSDKVAWAILFNSYGITPQTEKHNVRAVLAF